MKSSASGAAQVVARALGQTRPWLVRYARIGYAAKGSLYMLMGIFALGAALGRGGAMTDLAGVLLRLGRTPFGRGVLLLVALGLLGHAGLRLAQGLLDPERRGPGFGTRVFRVGETLTGLGYGLLAMGAIQLYRGRPGPETSDRKTRALSHDMLAIPYGDGLLGILGGLVIAFGLSMLGRAVLVKDVCQELDLTPLPRVERRAIAVLIRTGLVVQGLLFGLIGSFLIRAALDRAPSEARGMGGALRHLAGQPHGTVLLGLAALGLIAVALACFADARWRRFERSR